MLHFIKLMRPYQWIKNIFCLAGVIFGFHFNDMQLMSQAILGFMAFSLAASSVYVLNDIFDVKADRLHPTKRHRPLASNQVSIKNAWILCAIMIILSLIMASLLGVMGVLIILIYFATNIFYSIHGKSMVILDVFIISFGFLLRVFMGTTAIAIPVSEWLILCVITLTLFLGFVKRRSELFDFEATRQISRKVLYHYKPIVLDIFIAITATAAIISYALFLVIGKPGHHLVYTVIFVIYGMFRYIYLLYNQSNGQDTANDLLDDKHLIVSSFLWVITYLSLILY